jgi:hypothetical protein
MFSGEQGMVENQGAQLGLPVNRSCGFVCGLCGNWTEGLIYATIASFARWMYAVTRSDRASSGLMRPW